MNFRKLPLSDTIAIMVTTWFGSGLIPPPRFMKGMAGTYGSFFALPLCWYMVNTVQWAKPGSFETVGFEIAYAVTTAALFILGGIMVPTAERLLGPRTDWGGKTRTRDQNQLVIDEVVGMLIACWPLTLLHVGNWWLAYGLAFGLFRLFDIVKVPPAKRFDRMHSSFGVMMDDVVAGVQAAICLTVAVLVFRI